MCWIPISKDPPKHSFVGLHCIVKSAHIWPLLLSTHFSLIILTCIFKYSKLVHRLHERCACFSLQNYHHHHHIIIIIIIFIIMSQTFQRTECVMQEWGRHHSKRITGLIKHKPGDLVDDWRSVVQGAGPGTCDDSY